MPTQRPQVLCCPLKALAHVPRFAWLAFPPRSLLHPTDSYSALGARFQEAFPDHLPQPGETSRLCFCSTSPSLPPGLDLLTFGLHEARRCCRALPAPGSVWRGVDAQKKVND